MRTKEFVRTANITRREIVKCKLEKILDVIDVFIDSKPIAVMNVALWLIFVCIVFLIGVL